MSLLDARASSTDDPQPENTSTPLRRLLPYTTVLLVIALLYLAYTFYTRHQADVNAEAQLQAKQQAERERTAKAVFGDGEVKFTSLSIDARVLKQGETARLCYGVVNATTVTMDPPVEKLKPTYLHCMEISPKQTTKYTITASDGKGHSKSESVQLEVR